MNKTLIIAEKPSVARDIAKVLKCTKKGDGYLYNDSTIISWAIGHLVTLADPEDYSPALKTWKADTLPIIPKKIKLKASSNTKKQLDILTKIINSDDVTELVCATDSGREGELIFRYIYDITQCKKPFKRLWISSMTDQAIKEGFANLKDGTDYDLLYYSAKCRSEADWLVGINATRAFTLKYDTLLSVGRVQTPTLAIIVNRQTEINNFKVEEYFEIKSIYDGFSGRWNSTDNTTRIDKEEKALEIIEKVKGTTGIVKSVKLEDKKIPAPLLFDLTELQRECNKKYGFSAQKTLQIAQDLYEKNKCITYPRTDSKYISDDMVPKIKGILQSLRGSDYDAYINHIEGLNKLPITKRIVDNSKITDHHAIIPTDGKKPNLTGDNKKVYDLVVRRFIACFYSNYKYSSTTLNIYFAEENFVSKGTTVLEYGWKEVYNDTEYDKTDTEILPNLQEGDVVQAEDFLLENKKTKPPKYYNEASLLSAMEHAGKFVEDETLKEHLKESGIGTPATRASIIERLLTVGYITRKGKTLVPTEKGMKLIEIVPEELKSTETTGKWEKGLLSIQKGKIESQRFMESIEKFVKFIVQSTNNSTYKDVFPKEKKRFENAKNFKSFGKCPKCADGNIHENTKAFYCSNWKNGCKTTFWKNSFEKEKITLTGDIIEEILANKESKDISGFNPTTNAESLYKIVYNPNSKNLLEIKML